jgi:hypothetical protein
LERAEAYQILGGVEGDSPEYLLEDRLFEVKNYFKSKVPLSRLFKKQYDLLQKYADAMKVLGVQQVGQSEQPISVFTYEYENAAPLNVFNSYQSAINSCYSWLLNSNNPHELAFLGESLVQISYDYSAFWIPFDKLDIEAIVSSPSDPMEVYNELVMAQQNGVKDFDELLVYVQNKDSVLFREGKRLSLLNKMESEWRMSLES